MSAFNVVGNRHKALADFYGQLHEANILKKGCENLGSNVQVWDAENVFAGSVMISPHDSWVITPQTDWVTTHGMLDWLDYKPPGASVHLRVSYEQVALVRDILATQNVTTLQLSTDKALKATRTASIDEALHRFRTWAPKTTVIVTEPKSAICCLPRSTLVVDGYPVKNPPNTLFTGAAFLSAFLCSVLSGRGDLACSLSNGHANGWSVALASGSAAILGALLDWAGLARVIRKAGGAIAG